MSSNARSHPRAELKASDHSHSHRSKHGRFCTDENLRRVYVGTMSLMSYVRNRKLNQTKKLNTGISIQTSFSCDVQLYICVVLTASSNHVHNHASPKSHDPSVSLRDPDVRSHNEPSTPNRKRGHDNMEDDIWTEHTSSSGRVYYYNKRLDKSQWERPMSFPVKKYGWVRLFLRGMPVIML